MYWMTWSRIKTKAPSCSYMVGDNPASDIAGARNFGWESILVRTGVFRGEDNDSNHPATYVAKDVLVSVTPFGRAYCRADADGCLLDFFRRESCGL